MREIIRLFLCALLFTVPAFAQEDRVVFGPNDLVYLGYDSRYQYLALGEGEESPWARASKVCEEFRAKGVIGYGVERTRYSDYVYDNLKKYVVEGFAGRTEVFVSVTCKK